MAAGDQRRSKGEGAPAPNPDGRELPANADKAQRRAEALRANLKRRKAQQRDRAEMGKAIPDQDDGTR